MIYTYGFSLTGTSHIKNNMLCQDAHMIRTLGNGWVVAAIADGVGSAPHSEVASKIAVDTAVNFVDKYIQDEWDIDMLKALLKVAFNSALKEIVKEAKKYERPLSDYDTTLTVVVYNGRKIVYGHVGDGGIIALSSSGEYTAVTKVQKGEEFNVVVPLRGGPSEWVFDYSEEEFCSLLMLTDGLLDVALPSLLKEKVYVKFVRQFMDNSLIKITNSNFEGVKEEIRKYFEKDTFPVSDDKTLVGIINSDIMPWEREAEYYAEPDWTGLKDELNKKLYPNLYNTESSVQTRTNEDSCIKKTIKETSGKSIIKLNIDLNVGRIFKDIDNRAKK